MFGWYQVLRRLRSFLHGIVFQISGLKRILLLSKCGRSQQHSSSYLHLLGVHLAVCHLRLCQIVESDVGAYFPCPMFTSEVKSRRRPLGLSINQPPIHWLAAASRVLPPWLRPSRDLQGKGVYPQRLFRYCSHRIHSLLYLSMLMRTALHARLSEKKIPAST